MAFRENFFANFTPLIYTPILISSQATNGRKLLILEIRSIKAILLAMDTSIEAALRWERMILGYIQPEDQRIRYTYGEMKFGVPHIVKCFSDGKLSLAAKPKSAIFCKAKNCL